MSIEHQTTTPLLVSQQEAARLLGVERTTIWRMLKRKDLTSVQIGSRRLIPIASIEEFIANSTS